MKIGEKVSVDKKTGEIWDIITRLDGEKVAIVKMSDGTLEKVLEKNLVKIEEPGKGKDEITITRVEFMDAAVKLTADEMKDGAQAAIVMVAPILFTKLERKLFGDPEND